MEMRTVTMKTVENQLPPPEIHTMWALSPKNPKITKAKRLRTNLTQPKILPSTQKKLKPIKKSPMITLDSPLKVPTMLSQKKRNLTMTNNITNLTILSWDNHSPIRVFDI